MIAFDDAPSITIDDWVGLLVSNDLGGADQLGVLADDGAQSFSVSLFDFTQTLFTSDAIPLPTNGLTMADFGWSTLVWDSADGMLQGRLAQLHCIDGCAGPGPAPVPEPGSATLAVLGLALLRQLSQRRAARRARA